MGGRARRALPGYDAHGAHNRETTVKGGRPVLNEHLLNLPNWLALKLRIEGRRQSAWSDLELLTYRHELDIRNAVLTRERRFRDSTGR